MKKSILLILFVCSLAVSAFGDAKKDQTIDRKMTHPLIEFSKKYNFAKGAQKYSMFKLNESFTLEEIEYQGWNGSEFVSSSKTDFIYQSGNRTETRYYTTMDGGAEWQIDYRDLYEFTDNRIVSVTTQLANGEEYINDYRSLFTYQGSGGDLFLDEITDQYWNDVTSEWENEERSVFTITNGQISAGEFSMWDGTDWILYERFLLEEQENDLYLTYQDFDGTTWVSNERQIYADYTIDELYLLFIDELNFLETGTFLALTEMIPDYTAQEWDGSNWVDASRQTTETEYVGETSEILEKVITGQEFESEWITYSEVRITYQDGKAQELVLNSVEEFETTELIPVFAEVYEYDDQGQMKYAVEKYPEMQAFKSSGSTELEVFARSVFQWSGASTSIENPTAPVAFTLGNAYPNPFNPSTVIPFELNAASDISIRVFDMLGREVVSLVSGMFPAGIHTVRFDAPGLSSGIYLIRLDAPGYQQTRRVTLLK